MHDFKMEGIGNINGGEFDTITIEGVGNCNNNLRAKTLNIEGVFNCTGEVEAEYIYCEGVANFKSNIRTKKINIEGVLNQKGESKIEAEEIICDGVIKSRGEISVDRMDADGCIEAKEVVGDHIIINSRLHKNRFMNLFNREKSEINLVEATTIELSGVYANTVNGKDITIGPNCTIDNIDCSGLLSIDRTSVVKNITGEYTMRG
jgi:hypothetical protein